MPKRPNKRRGRPGKRRPQRRGPQRGSRRSRPADLVGRVRELLALDEPWPLLEYASTQLNAVDERNRPGLRRSAEPAGPSFDDVLESFFSAPLPETSALLTAIAALTDDDVLRHRVRREVADRQHVLPRWLVELDQSRAADRVVRISDAFGDGQDLLIGVEVPGGHALTAVVLIDENLGVATKDAFVLPQSVPQMLAGIAGDTDDPDLSVTDVDGADARALITDAIEHGARIWPPLESETWPDSRPLVEWIVRRLPEGGTGHEYREWSGDERQQIADRFLASRFGEGFRDDEDARSLLGDVLWFGTDYTGGDPLRWSPVRVDYLLGDWIPRKIVADVPLLEKAPTLLRAFIAFCHAERGMRPGLTIQTLQAVDDLEPEYQDVIRSPRPQGPAAVLAAMGALDPDAAAVSMPDDDRDSPE